MRLSQRLPQLRPLANCVLFFGVAGAVAAAVALNRDPPGPPSLDYPPVIDLGDVSFGDVAVGRFTVSNRGHSTLRLDHFSTSCSCAGVEVDHGDHLSRVDSLEVVPGGSVALAVRVAARARVGNTQSVCVAFASNDPANQIGDIEVVVPRVKGGVHAQPSTVLFGEVAVGSRPSQLVRLYDNGIPGREVAGVVSLRPDRFTAKLVPGVAGVGGIAHPFAGQQIAAVEITPNRTTPGPLDGRVEVRVKGESTVDRVEVSGQVVGPVICCPDAIVLPRLGRTD